ncbi:MAG: TRAP transporter small permease subunit, partial [Desulfobacteria bacterium]
MERIKSFINTIDAINDWTGRIFSWLIIPIIVIVVYEVILRKVFDAPTIWAFELTTILYGVHFMLGVPHTLLHKGHVSIDLIYSRFSPKVQAYIDVVTYI